MVDSEKNSQSASCGVVLTDNEMLSGSPIDLSDDVKRKLDAVEYLDAWYHHFCQSMTKFVEEKNLGKPGDDIFDNFLDYIRSLSQQPLKRRIAYLERCQGGPVAIDLNRIDRVSPVTGGFITGCDVYVEGCDLPMHLATPFPDMVKFWQG